MLRDCEAARTALGFALRRELLAHALVEEGADAGQDLVLVGHDARQVNEVRVLRDGRERVGDHEAAELHRHVQSDPAIPIHVRTASTSSHRNQFSTADGQGASSGRASPAANDKVLAEAARVLERNEEIVVDALTATDRHTMNSTPKLACECGKNRTHLRQKTSIASRAVEILSISVPARSSAISLLFTLCAQDEIGRNMQ